jgi:transketolase
MELVNRDLREIYVDLLVQEAKKHDNLVICEADLMAAAKTANFAKVFPERVVNVGVAEANMIGVAAGLANMGKIPFTHTFTPFASRRVADQVTLSVAYSGLNVKMVGSDPGICAELNGGTHMSMEDVAIMRNIPGMTVYEPVDGVQLASMMPQIVEHDGPVYIRLMRKGNDKVFPVGTEFKLGKAATVKEGKDVTIFATGIMVKESIEAAELLAQEGIDASVINLHTIKPLDEEAVIAEAKKTGAVVVAENHNIINGLGSAVAECLAENHPTPVKRVGVKDHFGEVGKRPFLQEKYEMLAKDIVKAAKAALGMKG